MHFTKCHFDLICIYLSKLYKVLLFLHCQKSGRNMNQLIFFLQCGLKNAIFFLLCFLHLVIVQCLHLFKT